MMMMMMLDTRMCNTLLVAESEEDMTWKQELPGTSFPTASQYTEDNESFDSTSDGSHKDYLAASMMFHPGHFACERIWMSFFRLHPRLKTGSAPSRVSRGIKALRSVLNAFSVSNRKNMFVLESSGNVFYL
ncbi:PREDICTED: protein SZT2-like, partial [Priapulus caudatus]|uniref:Protein SZT2-like n=1 Tax=Priapulus caudatus TaxID=37621 RepID=A0ABM1F6H2_PRICU